MQKRRTQPDFSEGVIFAPEGFIDRRYLTQLEHNEVRIIEVRMLSDGPMFHTIHHYPLHS